MSVRQRGDSWQADFKFGSKRYRKDFPSRESAEKWEEEMRNRLQSGGSAVLVDTQCPTLQKLFDLTFDRYWKGQKNERHARINGQDCVNVLGPLTPPHMVNSVAVEVLQGKLRSRDPKLAPSTINRKLAAMSKMLRYGRRLGVVRELPEIEREKEPEARIRVYSPDEEQQVDRRCKVLGYNDLADLFEFLIETGLRLSEALGLTWSMIDGVMIRLPGNRGGFAGRGTKSGKGRLVPMTDRAIAVVQRRKLVCPNGEDRILWGLNADRAHHQWDAVRSGLGWENDRESVLHSCRHTFCTRLALRGIGVERIQKLAGHSDISITLRYVHLRESDLVEAIRGPQAVTQPAAA